MNTSIANAGIRDLTVKIIKSLQKETRYVNKPNAIKKGTEVAESDEVPAAKDKAEAEALKDGTTVIINPD
ncbi:MAG: hypothetical protein P8N23_05950 [Methylophilaceae bacterium]|nr:hypothetical protein [Methylophilaceae bacterium]